MKISSFILFCLILILPTIVLAQWKRETGFAVGVVSPDYSKNYPFDEDEFQSLVKLGISQSWHKPDQPFSIRPEAGINLEYLPVKVGSGGLGGHSYYDGSIISINGELGVLTQVRVKRRLFFAIGPTSKYQIISYTKMTTTWWLMNQGGGEIKIKELNRQYLYKPSIGIKAILFERNIGEKISLGLSFEHQWKGSREGFINYSQTNEVSLYIGVL